VKIKLNQNASIPKVQQILFGLFFYLRGNDCLQGNFKRYLFIQLHSNVFRSCGANIVSVPMDEDGMRIYETCKLRLIHTIPEFF